MLTTKKKLSAELLVLGFVEKDGKYIHAELGVTVTIKEDKYYVKDREITIEELEEAMYDYV